MMQIEILRGTPEPNVENLFGVMSIAGAGFCMVQEPPIRADRLFVPGECALPVGSYNLSVSYCRRFRCELPLLAATPYSTDRRASFRTGMRIHHGVKAHEAYGEIVLGYRRINRTLVETHQAFDELMVRIAKAAKRGEAIDVEIK